MSCKTELSLINHVVILSCLEIRTYNNSKFFKQLNMNFNLYVYIFFQLQDFQKPHCSGAVIKLTLSDGKLKSIKNMVTTKQ